MCCYGLTVPKFCLSGILRDALDLLGGEGSTFLDTVAVTAVTAMGMPLTRPATAKVDLFRANPEVFLILSCVPNRTGSLFILRPLVTSQFAKLGTKSPVQNASSWDAA